jgi:hypothetical protein
MPSDQAYKVKSKNKMGPLVCHRLIRMEQTCFLKASSLNSEISLLVAFPFDKDLGFEECGDSCWITNDVYLNRSIFILSSTTTIIDNLNFGFFEQLKDKDGENLISFDSVVLELKPIQEVKPAWLQIPTKVIKKLRK